MIKNYLKQTWRNLIRNKTYSMLNIVGLAAGLTCFALIAFWTNDELSFDKFNLNYNRIFRVTRIAKTGTGVLESAASGAGIAKVLGNNYPEIEDAVRFEMREEIVEYKNRQFLEPGILSVDPSFFNIFSYTLTRGNMATALNHPYSIVLTQSVAKKYFGDADPIGQSLTIYMNDTTNRGAAYKITGVMPDPPKNAHFTFNMLASFNTIELAKPEILSDKGQGKGKFYTYLLLKEGVNSKKLSDNIEQFFEKNNSAKADGKNQLFAYRLQPLNKIYLWSHLQNEIAPTGDIAQVYIFLSIGMLILLLAGINYTNLATSRSVLRAKEVGIKKVAGATKRQLVLQYLSESVLTAMMALILSLIAVLLLKPFFYQLTNKNISLFASPLLLIFIAGVTFFLGILSGLYPAIILSSFKPVGILKGAFKSSASGILLRKVLVVSQFVITIILVTGIVIIYEQMSFISHWNLGFDKDALVYLGVNGNTDVIDGYEAFKNDLRSNPLISGIATSNSLIGGGLDKSIAQTTDIHEMPLQLSTSTLRVDTGYLNVYGVKLIAGRNFIFHASGDSITQIILNETAVSRAGWKNAEAAIGKPFTVDNQQGRVIGVTHDFHFNSLRSTIEPLAIYPVSRRFSRITVRADMKNTSQVIDLIQQTWKKHFPSALFDFGFLDLQIEKVYREEERFSKIFLYFSVLSILIACLGLYGLISFTASQRTKELGIRKVLGAATTGLIAMLLKDFLRPVLLACFIAMPVAGLIMNNWLQHFAYRISLSWWMFTAAGLLVLCISLVTVSFRAIKAALVNPVNSLRSE